MGAATPQRLGDFEIGREIGRGGMGVVYEARQVSLNRQVALKVLSGGLGLTPKAVQRFRREAEAAARLHHTNIVPVYATGEEAGTHFYAMELIDGPSLDQVIRQMKASGGRQPPDSASPPGTDARSPELAATGPYVGEPGSTQALSASLVSSGSHYFDTVARMIAEVADALEYAHQQGVIHRDLKPSNLLLSPAGRLSLTDFGLALVLEQPGMTLSGEFVGTPAYMSPEQITAGRIPLDHRTDIYSLGATLYELLTLEPPFTGKSREQVLAQIVQKEPKAPRRLNKRVPVDLETICLKCLEKDPDQRYQTAGALAEDLRRYVNRFAISARRAGPVQRLVKWARRRPAVAASLGCVLIAVCLMLVFAAQAHRVERRRIEEQERHRLQLLDEKVRNAYLVASSGDLKKTEQAIKEIEDLGGLTGQVRLLRGMASYFRGDSKSAIDELEQAVKLLPESVAARALLSLSYDTNGEVIRTYQLLDDLKHLSPSSAEDYLFKGLAIVGTQAGFADGLANLDEGIRLRDSPFGRALRAMARSTRAVELDDQKLAEEALDDADAAWHMMRDNPKVLESSIRARVIAGFIYKEAGLPEKRAGVLREAERDVRTLESQLDDLPALFWPVWLYYHHTVERSKSLKVARRALERSGTPLAASLCAIDLYQMEQFKEAFECLDQMRQTDLTAEMTRAFVRTELDDGPARAFQEYDKNTRNMRQSDLGAWKDVLLFLGKKEQVLAIVQKLDRTDGADWQYFLGKLSEDEYLAKAGNRSLQSLRPRSLQSLLHYKIGLFRLSKGDRLGARKHFQTSARCFWGYAKFWSLMFLSRMEKDPNWPAWIPVKK
jgi:serine/threonine protein kinase